jgi:cytochrome b561
MNLKNTKQAFGFIAKIFHWSIVLLVLIQYGTAFYKDLFVDSKDPLAGVLIAGNHKPFGIITLLVVFLAFMWHLKNPRVAFPSSMPRWEVLFATVIHKSLYLYLICMGLAGVLLNVFGGRGVTFWGFFEIPSVMEKQKELASFFYNTHVYLAFLGFGLVFLHFGGIIKQHLVRKDPVLQKMLPRYFEKYFR